MPRTQTIDSFCERCGTKYTFEQPLDRGKRLKGLGRTLGILGDEASPESIAMVASRDPFHGTFHFCLDCRQYTCPKCWNEEAGFCQGCAPLAEGPDLYAAEAAATWEAESHVRDALEELKVISTAEAWPDADIGRKEPDVEPEPEPEPEPLIAFEPETVDPTADPWTTPLYGFDPNFKPDPLALQAGYLNGYLNGFHADDDAADAPVEPDATAFAAPDAPAYLEPEAPVVAETEPIAFAEPGPAVEPVMALEVVAEPQVVAEPEPIVEAEPDFQAGPVFAFEEPIAGEPSRPDIYAQTEPIAVDEPMVEPEPIAALGALIEVEAFAGSAPSHEVLAEPEPEVVAEPEPVVVLEAIAEPEVSDEVVAVAEAEVATEAAVAPEPEPVVETVPLAASVAQVPETAPAAGATVEPDDLYDPNWDMLLAATVPSDLDLEPVELLPQDWSSLAASLGPDVARVDVTDLPAAAPAAIPAAGQMAPPAPQPNEPQPEPVQAIEPEPVAPVASVAAVVPEPAVAPAPAPMAAAAATAAAAAAQPEAAPKPEPQWPVEEPQPQAPPPAPAKRSRFGHKQAPPAPVAPPPAQTLAPGWRITAPDEPGQVWPPAGPVYQPPASAQDQTPFPYQQVQAAGSSQAYATGVQATPASSGHGSRAQGGIRPCHQCALPVSASARFCRRCGTPQQ